MKNQYNLNFFLNCLRQQVKINGPDAKGLYQSILRIIRSGTYHTGLAVQKMYLTKNK